MTVTLAGDPVEIESPIERVWEILTDLEKYPEWNPLDPHVDSTLAIGTPAILDVRMGRIKLVSPEIVTACEPPNRLGWGRKFPRFWPFLINANRIQTLTRIDNHRTLYHTSEPFGGLLGPIIVQLYGQDILDGFAAMSNALKMRAEQNRD